MAGDLGTLVSGPEKLKSVSHCLGLFENAPSEHAKTTIVSEKLVPWIQSKGMMSSQIVDISKLARSIVFLAFNLLD